MRYTCKVAPDGRLSACASPGSTRNGGPAAATASGGSCTASGSMNSRSSVQLCPRKGPSSLGDCNQRIPRQWAPEAVNEALRRAFKGLPNRHRRAVVSPAHEGPAARAGKIAKRTALGVVRRRGLWPARTSRKCGNALSAKRLAIRAGRPGPRGRTAGRAGATPPENGPRLRSRTLRGGRSRDLSLQEGWAVPGPWMRPSRMFGAHVNATDV